MKKPIRFLTSLTLLVGLSACTEPNPAYDPDPFLPGECRDGVEFTEVFDGFERPEKLDILFVVDNSGDVDDMQRALAEAIPTFVGTLDEIDLQIAVSTTDASGRVGLAAPGTVLDGCSSNGVQIARSEQSNFEKIVQCNLVQGTSGDRYQQSLNVVDRLFFDTSPEELGFFRADARIAVIIVSNEDDCSATETLPADGQAREVCASNADKLTNVKLFADALREIASTPEGVELAVISGPPATGGEDDLRPVCSSKVGASFSANRLFEAASAMGDQGYFTSLCVEDLDETMREMGKNFIAPAKVTLCAAKEMAHEPLAVTAVSESSRTAIRLGEDGFTFLGKTSACSNGAMQFAASSVTNLESVDVKYCAAAP